MFQNIANLHTRIPHLNATLASTYSKYRKFFPKIVRPLVEQYIYKISIDAFDSCFSLGSDCLAATILREINLRKCSGPFDWIAGLPYLTKLELIEKRFSGMLNREDLEYTEQKAPEGTIHVFNRKNNALFIHDFKDDSEEDYQRVTEKYARRQKRFFSLTTNAKVMLLYIEGGNDNYDYVENIDDVIEATCRVKRNLNARRLSVILCIKSDQNYNFTDVYERDGCEIYIQRFDSKALKAGEWTPYSTVNDLTKRTIGIAVNRN
jgi:hypothetical protein